MKRTKGRPGIFDGATITDQKRFVRGEHLLLARTLLRRRDEVHHRAWRVAILAGGSPEGEIRAIRELMPNAVVVAIDKDEANIQRAIAAGADTGYAVDLADFSTIGQGQKRPALPFRGDAKFDIFSLDLCGGPNRLTRHIVSVYATHILTSFGVFILTFSYGRDVQELFVGSNTNDSLATSGCPDHVAGRIRYLVPTTSRNGPGAFGTHSVLCYRGAAMPMCSVVFQKTTRLPKTTFAAVGHGDFEIACAYPDSANLYDCPADRIASFRRKFAAMKAHATMGHRLASQFTEVPAP